MNKTPKHSHKSQRYFSRATNDEDEIEQNDSKIKGIKRKNDNQDYYSTSPKKLKEEQDDISINEIKITKRIDHEYAKTLIKSIQVDKTEQRELKLNALKKWFEDKFVSVTMNTQGSFVCKDYLALLSTREILGEMEKTWEHMEDVVSGVSSSYVIKAFFEHIQTLDIKKCVKEDKELLNEINRWMEKFTKFCIKYAKVFLMDSIAIFILNTFLCTLGGLKKVPDKKKKKAPSEITWHLVPKKFNNFFSQICSTLLENISLEDCLEEDSSHLVSVLLTLLEVLHHRKPEECSKALVPFLKVFHNKDSLDSQSGSLLAEKLWSLVEEAQQSSIYAEHLQSQVHALATSNFGKYFIQKALENCASKDLFKSLCKELYPHISQLMASDSQAAVLVSISRGCLKHPSAQKKFSKDLRDALQLGDKPLKLVERVLKLGRPEPECVAGSMLLQSLFQFDNPVQAADSFLLIKGQRLLDLGCSPNGSYIFQVFFSSPTMKEKYKKDLQRNLKPFHVKLAVDKFGSHVFDALWSRADPKGREAILEEFLDSEEELQNSQNWKFIRLKTDFNLYKYNKVKWQKMYGENAK